MRVKRAVAVCFMMAAYVATATAQDWGDRQSRSSLTIGPGFHAGASMTLDPPERFKLKPTLALKGELHATYPLSPAINVGFGIGYERRGTYMHVHNQEANGDHLRLGFVDFHPHFVFSGFSLGMVFGLPVGDIEFFGGFGGGDDGPPIMLEPRLEGIIPIADMEDGWFSIVIGGGYSLTPLIDVESTEFFGDWHHVSAHLGMRFEYRIPGTDRKSETVE